MIRLSCASSHKGSAHHALLAVRRPLTAALVVLVLGALGSVGGAHSANAATVSCDTPTLVSAISTANATPGGGTLTLTTGCVYTLASANNTTDGGTGLPVITGNVTIQGAGATITRSSATGVTAFRIFDVASGGSLTLNTLTLSNGLANNGQQGGGAIFNHGTLAVTAGTFTNNSSPATTGTSGGAIDSSGTLTVTTSTFSGNSAQEGGGVFNQNIATIINSTFTSNTATIYGGGASVNGAGTETLAGDTFVGNTGPGGGALDNDATLNISNSTFTNNTAGTNGGGAVVNFGTTTLTQSTFSGNTSPYGANIYNFTGFTLSMSMDIVAGGLTGTNCAGQAPITDLGYNIDTGSSCGFTATTHSLNNTQPRLDALASNGGSTQTMGLPAGTPAIDAIPSATPGCTGSTDQRGIARPQGNGCDIGAYELVVTTGDAQPPSVPTGLAMTSVTSSSVSLSWNASSDNVGVTGYTIYRNGASVGSTGGPAATTFTDLTASPNTSYSYTVDAFDGSGNHSGRSQPVSVLTPAPSGVGAVQTGATATATRVTSTTIVLANPVHAGDLLAGWLGQFDAAGQVQVSDNVNGPWTRSSASTTFSSGAGDLALFYVQNSAPAPWGLTITITASSPTFLQGAVSEYSGVATANALDQVAAAKGTGTAVDSGPTAPVGAGELVVGGIITGGSPGTVTPGSSQAQPFTLQAQTSSGSADIEDIAVSSAGAQNARATFSAATDWYAAVGVFHPYGTQPPPTTSVLIPSNGATLSGSTTLDASASNATSVEFRLFGGVYGYNAPVLCTATLTYYGWLCTWNTATVPNGSYALLSEAFNSGGSAFSSGVSITVHN
jgi:chitodextrinase